MLNITSLTKDNIVDCMPPSPAKLPCSLDEVSDARLLKLATERFAAFDLSATVSAEVLYGELDIDREDLDAVGEVEIE